MLRIRMNSRGFGHLLVVLVLLLVGSGVAFAGYMVISTARDTSTATQPIAAQTAAHSTESAAEPDHQIPAPATPDFTTPITIKGDDICQEQTLAALKLLSDKAPAHYATVTSYIGIIECAAQGSGMFAPETPPRFVAGNYTRNAGTVWYASTIAHDAGHSRLYHEYRAAHPGQRVPDEIWTGRDAEAICLAVQQDALALMGGTERQLEHLQSVINTEYYNVPYENRWW